ncbi:MAG TPA: alpha/beta hydrolase [Flavisolibacter sp.]|nr:alpha/beta hydrolase [Flavisolibacter sp.]
MRLGQITIGFGRSAAVSMVLLTCMVFSACSKDNDGNNDDYEKIQPKGPKPSWGPTITKQMQAVIETLDTIAPRPLHQLTPQQARLQPSAADAAMRVMRNFAIPMPPMNVDTVGRDIPVTGGTIHLRIYTPRTGKASYPMIVYYHGGGWVIATIDTYNASSQALAEKADAVLVSVEYRKGPEYKFPTAHNDAFAAYKWTLRNASTIKGDSTKIAVAGESAGGNLAITVGMMARDSGVRKPVHAVAVYPVASGDPATPSKLQYTMAKPLSTPDLPWFLMHYLNNPAEAANPLISLVNANLNGLPKTTIIAAEIDPLLSEGKMLDDKLRAAGVQTTYRLFTGVTHEFFGMASVLPEARDAQNLAADELKKAWR